MKSEEKKTSMLEDVPAALAAGVYGVPKSLIAGYFLTKFFTRNDERDRKIEIERQRVEAETWLNDLERKRGRTREFLGALARYEEIFGPRQNTSSTNSRAAYSAASSHQQSLPEVVPGNEKNVKNWPLIIGILFMPYIFSWVTLKDGYSKNSRILSFAWMVVVIIIVANDMAKH
jgi:hypothetical protein